MYRILPICLYSQFLAWLFCATQVQAQSVGILNKETIEIGDYYQNELVYDSLNFFRIEYQSDSALVEGFIVEPITTDTLPIVIFNRGGNRDFAKITNQTLVDWISPIATAGFRVFASQYRIQDEFGGSDLNDVLAILEIAKKYPKTDSTKVGMVGWSRGGLMTYLALTRTNEIDCAIIGGAPSDFRQLIIDRPRMDMLLSKLIPEYESHREIELEKRSPILWADSIAQTKLLIIHGQDDERVSSEHSIQMSDKLNSIGYQHQIWIVQNDNHILNKSKAEKDKRIAEWLTESLQNR